MQATIIWPCACGKIVVFKLPVASEKVDTQEPMSSSTPLECPWCGVLLTIELWAQPGHEADWQETRPLPAVKGGQP